jgi:hypothetical protein
MGVKMSRLAGLLVALVAATPAGAQTGGAKAPRPATVQIAPLAGYQFGGSFQSATFQDTFSMSPAPLYGGAIAVRVYESWHVEAQYVRATGDLEPSRGGAPSLGVTFERMMVGVQEEKGEKNTKFFGNALLGATRVLPELRSYKTSTRFTVTATLGVKQFIGENFGLRLEANAYWMRTSSSSGLFCGNGACLFAFSGDGFLQTSVLGGVILRF